MINDLRIQISWFKFIFETNKGRNRGNGDGSIDLRVHTPKNLLSLNDNFYWPMMKIEIVCLIEMYIFCKEIILIWLSLAEVRNIFVKSLLSNIFAFKKKLTNFRGKMLK
jgi:hypothetical protein